MTIMGAIAEVTRDISIIFNDIRHDAQITKYGIYDKYTNFVAYVFKPLEYSSQFAQYSFNDKNAKSDGKEGSILVRLIDENNLRTYIFIGDVTHGIFPCNKIMDKLLNIYNNNYHKDNQLLEYSPKKINDQYENLEMDKSVIIYDTFKLDRYNKKREILHTIINMMFPNFTVEHLINDFYEGNECDDTYIVTWRLFCCQRN